jgi:hypothetical protein
MYSLLPLPLKLSQKLLLHKRHLLSLSDDGEGNEQFGEGKKKNNKGADQRARQRSKSLQALRL